MDASEPVAAPDPNGGGSRTAPTGAGRCDADGSEAAAPPAKTQRTGFHLAHAVSLLLAVAITVAVIIFRNELARFAAYGYLGIFIVTLVGNATVILPVPGLVAVFAGGTAFNPWLVGLIAGVAQPIGELTGYLAGYGGGAVVENRALYAKLCCWMERHGFLTILVLAAIPNPVFDMAGIIAGALHMPVWKFLLACFLGKTAKSFAVAWLGQQSAGWMAPLLNTLK
ncbi:MAG TPA: VTT domain-containing protein [Anaerolineae bacterium]|nr:VTT domain-containing protein [Anaerolineae bacterium]HOR00506.1 VTT domain-containing protein [Anaerolineae bacterium]HPL30343.1 VTT domain-containing protein [Anaerolineae bacterium]